ncbi:condensation domain-containing protein [Kribbella speibonae]|uniref:Condensation domain-containing protein n=1 Tax=Kribbella speibonae TaxID=1572660 RepID=A0A4R0J4U9_9ACTN|nr:condensation domain-containing protein [Kribbella speibonae]TCC36315.1 hypothetical protein E0H92_27060 [Kribbella speibonae]
MTNDDFTVWSRCVDAVRSAVPFPAVGEVVRADLMYSQEFYWNFYYAVPEHNGVLLDWAWTVPEGVTVADVAVALNQLVERRVALRTKYPVSLLGLPMQCVHPAFDVPILTWQDTTGGGLRELTDELSRRPIDPAVDWPIRAGVLLRGEVPVSMVLVFNHLTLDGISTAILRDEFLALLKDPQGLPEVIGREPISQAAYEKTASEVGRHERVLAYWRRCFEQMPNMMFTNYRKGESGSPGREGGTSFTAATLSTVELVAAAEMIAARHRLSSSTIFLTAYVAVLSIITGHRRCSLYVASANRFDPEVQPSVGCFFQCGIMVADILPEMTVLQAAKRLRAQSLTSYGNAHHSFWNAKELAVRAADERGVALRVGVYYNFTQPQEATYRDELQRTAVTDASSLQLTWEEDVDWEDYDTDLYLRVVPNDPKGLFLLAHDSVLSRDEMERILTAMVTLISLWAEDSAIRQANISHLGEKLGLERRQRTAHWTCVDHCWINVSELTDLLCAIPAVITASVFSDGAGDEQTLIAYLASSDPEIEPNFLRRRLLGSLATHPNIMVPHRFVVCTQAPVPNDEQGWKVLPVATEGDGKDPLHLDPSTREEMALLAVLETFNPGMVKNMARSYVLANGRAAVVPAIIGRLALEGYSGILPEDLLGPQPLSAVAAMLQKCPRP